MSFSETTERNAVGIALVVSILALIFSAVPWIRDMSSASGASSGAVGIPEGREGRGPGGGEFGDRPMGGTRGGRGPSPEVIEKYRERAALLVELAGTYPVGSEKALQAGLECDLARMMVIRLEAGGRRIAAGAAEAWLKFKVAEALRQKSGSSPEARLAVNQAELDLLSTQARVREQDLFTAITGQLAAYPGQPATAEQLAQLLQAEMGAPGEGAGPGPGFGPGQRDGGPAGP